MMINKKYMFIVGFSLLSVLLLVSATTMNNDTDDSKNMTLDGVVFNFTATPYRLSTNDSMGYTEVNITTDKDVNKSFTLSSGSGESSTDLLDNRSVSLNTTVFNVPDGGLNKSYSLTDGNGSSVSLVVEFKEGKPFDLPLGDMLQSTQSEYIVNTTIQDAVDQASPGDTVIIPYKAGDYKGTGNKNINISKNLTIMGSGGDVVIDAENNGRIFNITGSSVNISGLKIQNTSMNGDGGAIIYPTSGNSGSVINCTFTNTRSNFGGGAVRTSGGSVIVINSTFTNTASGNGNSGGAINFQNGGGSVTNSTFTNIDSSSGGAVSFGGGGSVSGCTIVNCTSRNGGAGIHVFSGGVVNVSYNRFVNNTVNGSLSNVNGFSGSRDFNWWGTNNINNAGIAGSLPDKYYQIELSAGDTSTRDVNKTVNGLVPVALSYKMALNGSNDTGNINNLPDFNATLTLNNNTGFLLRNFINNDLFRVLHFTMIPGDVNYTLAKNPWNDTINSTGNYTFSGVVDNQQLNLNINATERMNTSLSLNASNITYGDNTSIGATLTDNNGTVLGNKTITFNINGTNYTATTDGSDVAVLSIPGLGVGVYNVFATFSGDSDYNPSNNNTTFSVDKMNTSLNINKTVNGTNVIVGDLVGYTIQVTNNGTNNITTPILVNDTLSSSLEYVSSVGSSGVYDSGTGLWSIPSLNINETATLNMIVRVKDTGSVVNHAYLLLGDDFNNALANDSSVSITVNPNNGGGDNNTGGSDDGVGGDTGSGDGFDQTFFKSLETGFPLIVLLVVLSVLGLVYRRK